MIFPSDLELRLGFDQIRDRISRYCVGDLGRSHTASFAFLTTQPEIERWMSLNLEVKSMLDKGDDLPLKAYIDPAPWLEVAAVDGSYLEAQSLSELGSTLQMMRDVSRHLTGKKEEYPQMNALNLPPDFAKKLVSIIREKVDDAGTVKDGASVSLGRIRRRLREEELKARRVADHILRQALENGWCPDGSNPTIREGRLVIPVLAEHKRKIKGYLVDQSSTGQTVYLEPADVMEANNDLRDLTLEERKEIIKILLELTSSVREHLLEIQEGYTFLGVVDGLRARGRLARDLNSAKPLLTARPALKWTHARHPLLHFSLRNKRPLVPLSITLTEDDRMLLVSGPNAGGKSVCLKTVGLIQYMAQCGLLVPMDADSEVGIFESIFLDIGDQQSIESDLSTYSSHLRNMAHFIHRGNDRTLVLMDELGSGTDPNFGGGIAQAILEQLLRKKTWGVATTHYYNLKVFASHFPGIRNASMQFDREKLVPLFLLEIGQPGSSFALEIAMNTGLGEQTLRDAERIIGSELIGLETLMKNVADEKVRLAERDKIVSKREAELTETLSAYEELKLKLETQQKEILNKAKSEASALLQETNREIEKTIRHIRENKAEQQETRKVRQGLKELGKKVKPQAQKLTGAAVPFKVDDKVRMMGGEVTGTILSIKGSTAMVQFGNLRSTVKLDRLVRSDLALTSGPATGRASSGEFSRNQQAFSPQLDVRGMRVDEVMAVLIRFIDDAVLFGLAEVRVLHGKGEGVLRKVVRDYLKKQKYVTSFQDEHADRGGAGITLVRLE